MLLRESTRSKQHSGILVIIAWCNIISITAVLHIMQDVSVCDGEIHIHGVCSSFIVIRSVTQCAAVNASAKVVHIPSIASSWQAAAII